MQQPQARAAPHTVCANQGIAFDLFALFGGDGDGFAIVLVVVHGVVQVQVHIGLGLHGVEQQLVQIGAVDGRIRSAVAGHRIRPQGEVGQGIARQGIA